MNNNRIVKASAGTGKTFDIATQFIRLLVFEGDVRPETILGLTFSRAAAQEIYEKILGRLRAAASSDAAAEEERDKYLLGDVKKKEKEGQALSDNERWVLAFVPKGGWTAAMFAGILRRVIDAQGHGTVATIDSFIQRIVQKFPLETGFQKALSVLDDYGAKTAAAAAVAGVLSTTGGDDDVLSDFFVSQNGAAVRSGTGKLADADLVGENDSWLTFLREHPNDATWKAETMAAKLGIERPPVKPDLSAVRVGEKEKTKFLGKIWDLVDTFDGTQDLYPRIEGAILRHFFENPDATCFEFKHGNGKNNQYCFDCGREGAEALRAAVRYMAAVAINRRLDIAAAKLRLCKAVEDRYAAAVRRKGLLTFSDFTYSLVKAGGETDGTRRLPAPETWLLDLQFRLDSEFSHWALDEFQDTSTAQWACLKPLVEEAVSQGAAGENRSVLAVGDLKQSIYRWRGGCNEPFESLEKTVRANHGAVETRAKSWRYGKNTAEFVNEVFRPENLGEALRTLCPDAVGKWENECWPEGGHDAVEGANGDYVEITGVPPSPTADDDAPGDDEHVSAVMKKLYPALCDCVAEMWDRHEEDRFEAEKSGQRFKTDSIGILVRRNGDGVYLAEKLRKTTTPNGRRIPVIWEGTSGVLDSPVVCGVLELLRLAEHPGDDFAWNFVDGLFPVRETVFPEIDTRAGVSAAVSSMLSRRGLARTLETFATKLKAVAPSDRRTAMRLDRLVREGAKFAERPDAGGVDDFRKYLETVSDRDIAASSGVVRILTIHRAKGLTLDHVVVPITSSDKLTEPKSRSRLAGDGWIVEGLDADLIAANPKTKAAWAAAANGHLLDELCTWYVALTRARKSTRVFFVDDGATDGSRFCDLLRKPFPALARASGDTSPTVCHSIGETDPAFVTFPPPEKDGDTEAPVPEPVAWEHDGKRVDVRHETPSTAAGDHGGTGPDFVSNYFKPSETRGDSAGRGREKAQRYGVDEHAEFAKIEWIDSANPQDDREKMILDWGGTWAEAFRETSGAIVWRERSYELFDRDKNVWETGQFDRVVFRIDNGKRKADIYDFKTNVNREKTLEAFEKKMRETYESQMAAYRSAISRLCGIQPENISSTLLLTATGTAVKVE